MLIERKKTPTNETQTQDWMIDWPFSRIYMVTNRCTISDKTACLLALWWYEWLVVLNLFCPPEIPYCTLVAIDLPVFDRHTAVQNTVFHIAMDTLGNHISNKISYLFSVSHLNSKNQDWENTHTNKPIRMMINLMKTRLAFSIRCSFLWCTLLEI